MNNEIWWELVDWNEKKDGESVAMITKDKRTHVKKKVCRKAIIYLEIIEPKIY